MPHSLTVLLFKTIAKAYGGLALVASVTYGLTRRETWYQPSAKEKQEFQQGILQNLAERLICRIPDRSSMSRSLVAGSRP